MLTRWTLFVCLLALTVNEASSSDDSYEDFRSPSLDQPPVHSFCEKWLPFFPSCSFRQVPRSDPEASLRELLDRRLFGQNHVKAALVEMFEKHFASHTNGKGSPSTTSFQIAGEKGIGKTFVLSLMARAAFHEDQKAVLIIDGQAFVGQSEEATLQHRSTLTKLMLAHIKKYPWCLIVLDNAQYVHADTIIALEPFLDNSRLSVVGDDGVQVDKSRAIIGIITDFNRDPAKKPPKGSDIKELRRELVVSNRNTWRDGGDRFVDLIQYLFPFAELEPDDISNIIHDLLTVSLTIKNVERVGMTQCAARKLADRYLAAFPHVNARNIKTWVDEAEMRTNMQTGVKSLAEQRGVASKISILIECDPNGELRFKASLGPGLEQRFKAVVMAFKEVKDDEL